MQQDRPLEETILSGKTLGEIASDKFRELQHALQLLELEKDELTGKEREFVRQLQAWSIILEAQRPGEGPAGAGGLAQNGGAAQRSPDPNIHGSKTNMVRTSVMQAGIVGVTPKEISEKMAKAGFHVSSSFANNALFRMKEKKEVFVAGGRYILVQFAKQQAEPVEPEQNMSQPPQQIARPGDTHR